MRGHPLEKLVVELTGGENPFLLEPLIECGHFEEDRDVAARAKRQNNFGHFHAEKRRGVIFEAEPVVIPVVLGHLQPNDELDAGGVFHGAHAENLFDVDDAEAAHFHVVLEKGAGRADEDVARVMPDFDDESETRMWPRLTSSRPHSDLPEPESPMIITPRP